MRLRALGALAEISDADIEAVFGHMLAEGILFEDGGLFSMEPKRRPAQSRYNGNVRAIVYVAELDSGPEAMLEADVRWWQEAGAGARLAAVDEARRDLAKLGGAVVTRDLPGTNRDFEELLHLLNEHGARYLIVGAYAVAFHATPRFTKDLDILIEPSADNAPRVIAALTAFIGDPGVAPERLAHPGTVLMMGIPPTRVDVLTSISGVHFAEAWAARAEGRYGAEQVGFIGLDDLIRAKRAAGREQDLIDVRRLEKVRALRAADPPPAPPQEPPTP